MYCGWSPSRITSPSLYPESGASTPPSSLYCCQRSASISSAAARSWRIAASPALSLCLPLAANALLEPLSKAAPGTRRAAPIPRFRRKERLARRFGGNTDGFSSDDSMVLFMSLECLILDCIRYEFIVFAFNVVLGVRHIASRPSLPIPRDFIPSLFSQSRAILKLTGLSRQSSGGPV